MGLGQVGLGCDGAAQRGFGVAMLALTQLCKRTIHVDLGEVGPEREHLAIGRLGFRQAPGLMQPDRPAQLRVEHGIWCGHGFSFPRYSSREDSLTRARTISRMKRMRAARSSRTAQCNRLQ